MTKKQLKKYQKNLSRLFFTLNVPEESLDKLVEQTYEKVENHPNTKKIPASNLKVWMLYKALEVFKAYDQNGGAENHLVFKAEKDIYLDFSKLSIQQRQIVVLTLWEDLSVKLTAKTLKIDKAQVEKELKQAKEEFKSQVDKKTTLKQIESYIKKAEQNFKITKKDFKKAEKVKKSEKAAPPKRVNLPIKKIIIGAVVVIMIIFLAIGTAMVVRQIQDNQENTRKNDPDQIMLDLSEETKEKLYFSTQHKLNFIYDEMLGQTVTNSKTSPCNKNLIQEKVTFSKLEDVELTINPCDTQVKNFQSIEKYNLVTKSGNTFKVDVLKSNNDSEYKIIRASLEKGVKAADIEGMQILMSFEGDEDQVEDYKQVIAKIVTSMKINKI